MAGATTTGLKRGQICSLTVRRSAKAQRLVPDSESDRAFVEAVVDMHDAFDAPTRVWLCLPASSKTTNQFPSVSEMVLRKNYQSGVYGKRTFGRETFFQLRQPMNRKSQVKHIPFMLHPSGL